MLPTAGASGAESRGATGWVLPVYSLVEVQQPLLVWKLFSIR